MKEKKKVISYNFRYMNIWFIPATCDRKKERKKILLDVLSSKPPRDLRVNLDFDR